VARRVDTPEPARGAGDEQRVDLTAVDPLPILLVDDRPENLRTLEGVLEPLGFPLQAATSGAEALRLLLERDFALILLDVRMPGLDGLETARLIKGRARTRDVPIVFLTAARDEVGDIIRGYDVGAIDYVLKPFDPDVLRSKVAVFAELEASRRALKRAEAFLRAAFEAAPIGQTVLNGALRIVRSNRAFASLVGREPAGLQGAPVLELCHPDDRDALTSTLERAERAGSGAAAAGQTGVDLRVRKVSGADVWIALVATSIEPVEFAEPLLLVQWVDVSARRRAEQARAELLMEQAARTHAEAMAERLGKLQTLSGAIESLSLNELLPELAGRLAELFDAEAAEVQISGELSEPVVVRAAGGRVFRVEDEWELPALEPGQEMPLLIDRANVGVLRLTPRVGRSFTATERSLLRDVAERAALSIQRAQLHEQEHRIAVELQRGLLPKRLPAIAGIELAAHYQAAGLGAEAGGDWYDAFPLSSGRVGVVVGDVAGRGVPAASAMGQLRSVTRALALADEGPTPGEVLTRLNRHQLALGQDELFTIVYAIIDPREATIAWANAGHPPPLLRSASGGARYLEGGEGLTGIEDIIYEDLRAPIGERDVLILYTDGLIERRGESLDAGLERLSHAACTGPDDPADLCAHILGELAPPETQLHDDVTAVLVRVG
jgi:PAS domain S-box-containing protein